MSNGQELVFHEKSFRQLTMDELYELLRVRSDVFVVEQNCVYQDLDGHGSESRYAIDGCRGRSDSR